MEKLNKLISNHNFEDKSRSSLSNLVKKIKLDNELFLYVNSFLTFGTFKQKLHHYLYNKGQDLIICGVCCVSPVNWIDSNNSYRQVCSTKCSGRLNKTRNVNKKIYINPKLSSKKDFIDFFLSTKKRLTESNISKIYPELVLEVNKLKFETEYYSEKVYFYLYDLISKPICEHCKYNTVNFDTFKNGYYKYCSVKCSSNSDIKKNDIINTCLDKYGVKNIGEVTREKAAQTMVERYGGHISTTEQFREKYRNTAISKYDEVHFSKTKEFLEKYIKTCNIRFGYDNPKKEQLTQISALAMKYSFENDSFTEISSFDEKMKLTTDIKKRYNEPDGGNKKILGFNHYGSGNYKYKDEREILDEFFNWSDEFSPCLLIAQNASFDMAMLSGRYGHKIENEVFDTKMLIQLYLLPLIQKLGETDDKYKSMVNNIGISSRDNGLISSSMAKVGPALNINMNGYHDALTDVKITIEMYQKIVDILKENKDVDISKYQIDRIKSIRLK